jgi:hypothetical protein
MRILFNVLLILFGLGNLYFGLVLDAILNLFVSGLNFGILVTMLLYDRD